MQKERLLTNKGFVLIDLVVSTAVLIIVVGAFAGAIVSAGQLPVISGDRNRAAFLAEEGLEASRNIRDASYANLVNGTYGLAATGNQYSFSGSQDVNGIFTRSIQIVTVNSTTQQITSTVTWKDYINGSVVLTTYLINPALLGQAGNVTINTGSARRSGSIITGITATNNGTASVSIKSVNIGGVVTTESITIGAGVLKSLGNLNAPSSVGTYSVTVTFGDNSTKTF